MLPCASCPTRSDLVPKSGPRGDSQGTIYPGWGSKMIGYVRERVLRRKNEHTRMKREDAKITQRGTSWRTFNNNQFKAIEIGGKKLRTCRHQKHGILIAADVKGPITKPVRWWVTIQVFAAVNNGPHIRRWSNNILWYHCVTIAYRIQYSNMLYRLVA
jgi:hypothetical protein